MSSLKSRPMMDEWIQNWIKIATLFPQICEHLSLFVDNKVNKLHQELVRTLGTEVCKKDCQPGNKRTRCLVCNKWCQALKKHSDGGKLFWDNADPQQWPTNCWEVAKVYMNPGQRAGRLIQGVEQLDISSMLTLILNCKAFGSKKQWKTSVREVLEIRNKVFHQSSQSIPDAQFSQMQKSLIKFLEVGYCIFDGIPDIEGIKQRILKLKETNVHITEGSWLEVDASWKQMLHIVDEKLKEQGKALQDHEAMLQDHEKQQQDHGERIRQLEECFQQCDTSARKEDAAFVVPGNQQKFVTSKQKFVDSVEASRTHEDRIKNMTARGISSHQGTKYFDPIEVLAAMEQSQQDWIKQQVSQSQVVKALKENCNKLNFAFHGDTPADGNCFYNAISDQLTLLGLPHQSAKELRESVVEFLRKHPYIQDHNCSIDFQAIHPDWAAYCDKMARDGEWADHIVLIATAHTLRRDIIVVTSSPQGRHGADPSIRISCDVHCSRQPFLLGHVWECHYHSLQKIESQRLPEMSSHATTAPAAHTQLHSEGFCLHAPIDKTYKSLRSVDTFVPRPDIITHQQMQEQAHQSQPATSIQIMDSMYQTSFDWMPECKKRILVVYSDDNELHTHTVRCFRDFLIEHCCCDPVVLLSEHDPSVPFQEWFEMERRHADKILVIFSEEARKWPDMISPCNDARMDNFWIALRSIQLDFDKNQLRRYLIAHFNYSPCSVVIPPMSISAVYKLMENIEQLMFRIHDISPSGPGFDYKLAPYLKRKLIESDKGHRLSLAIHEMGNIVERERQDSHKYDTEYEELSLVQGGQALTDFFTQ